MLAKFWNNISNAGIELEHSQSASRYIILTNRFAFISGLISFLVLALLYWSAADQEVKTAWLFILFTGIVFFLVLFINKYGQHELAKWLICWLPAILVIFLSISDKSLSKHISIQDFFSYRFFLMATVIIPLMVFGTSNPLKLIFNLLPSFIGTVFFDYFHRPFGLAFNQLGYNDPNFYILDIMIALAYFGLVGFLLNQVVISEKFEQKMNEQQQALQEKNRELVHMNSFINEQNYEMNAQADRLTESRDALLKASQIIENQKQQLINQNKTLEKQVVDKTKDLSRVNEELIIINSELRQFSHTLSHNLRSPVSTFQGLLNLIDRKNLSQANLELLDYLHDTVRKMHEVFSDMNEMLELRNTLYQSIEEVDLQKLIDELYNIFYAEMQGNNISFKYDFNGQKVLKTNERRLNGILFHLISNSIKFRSECRPPEINISLRKMDGYYSIVIRDNGVGIDLEKYGHKLFYPYQRFHSYKCGKGLGLYLVKLQTESLGGKVMVRSQPDRFTEVEVQFLS
ncbi:MAG: hypothetical protein HC819_08235 [Cyclobacteriaceae bacterium]|nr:hypothetical protein [Cyclobacteriaceae bacterium]